MINNIMKAAVLTHYDKNGTNLEIQNISVPTPANNEVLVQIKTAAVNPLDNMIIRGEVKLIVPYKPPVVLGNEFAGDVVAVGSAVRDFHVGDRVYGRMPLKKIGAFAEYTAVAQESIAVIPEYLSYDQAATVPLAALTAMQAFELMDAQKGKTVFISGGTGSLGAMAIPVAKSLGLKVITNGSSENKDRVLALGVDRFIDYKTEEYTEVLHDVDYVLDTLGERELPKEFTVLKKGGSLVSLRGMPNKDFAVRSHFSVLKRFLFGVAGKKYDNMAATRNQKYYFLFVHEDGKQLDKIGKIFSGEHHLDTSIDTIYSLEEVNMALDKVKNGKSKGKTIIKINE